MIRATWLLLAVQWGCSDPPLPPVEEGGDPGDVAFEAVQTLGPHRFVANSVRVDIRIDDDQQRNTEPTSYQESEQLLWDSPEHFHLRRKVNGETVFDTIVAEGHEWNRGAGGGWRMADEIKATDRLAESEDAWHRYLDPFGDRVRLTEDGREEKNGRQTVRYKVSLEDGVEKPTKGHVIRRSAFKPTSLDGMVWVDVQTGLRIAAEVQGALSQGNLRRKVKLSLARLEIGQPQTIQVPTAWVTSQELRATAEAKAAAAKEAEAGEPEKAQTPAP